MEPTTAQFLADSLERAGRVLCHMEAAAQVLSDYAKGKGGTPGQSPSQATVSPERLEQIKHEVEQAAQVGKQALEQWRSQHQQ